MKARYENCQPDKLSASEHAAHWQMDGAYQLIRVQAFIELCYIISCKPGLVVGRGGRRDQHKCISYNNILETRRI